MDTTIYKQLHIPASLAGHRLDQALAVLCHNFSRAQIQLWINQGDVQVDHVVCSKGRYKVKIDQHIIINTELTPREHWEAQPIDLNIVYSDDDLIIVNKPAGLVVHPGAGNPDQTLINALLHYDQALENIPRAGLIHRLDKDTSGLLVVARNLSSHNQLVKALAERNIKREYQAIIEGTPISGGTIDAPIGRHSQHRTKMSVKSQGGRPATTHYRITKRFHKHTHIHIILDTGRTHQIRVHCAHIRHPIVGDPLYGRKSQPAHSLSSACRLKLKQFSRQALHAHQLTLQHPSTLKTISWQAPLPQDMQSLLDQLTEDLKSR